MALKANLDGEQNVERKIKEPKFKKTQVIPEEVANLLIRQISRELYNRHLYNTFATYFSINGLDNLEDYYRKRAEEENNHHKWIYDYLQDCQVLFSYPKIDAIEVEIEKLEDPFDLTIDAEIETTEWINEIVDKAKELKDWQTFKWLDKLVMEQVEEESLTLKVAQMANQECDWLTKASEILNFYNEEQNDND